MSNENHERRISMLEIIAETGEKHRQDTIKRIDYVESRLDSHLIQNAQTQMKTAEEVGRLASAVENIGLDVKDAIVASTEAKTNMLTAKAVWATILAMAGAGTVATAAVWTLFTYLATK